MHLSRSIILSFFCIELTLANLISANYKNFKEIVLDSPHITMVEFYAPWCGHCKNFEPEYRQAADRLKGFARLVQVDCDNSVNRELCGRYDIKGFPTIKIFSSGVPTDYQGERKSKAVVDTLIPLIPSKYVMKIGGKSKKAVSFEDFKNTDDQLHKVLLISDKKSTSPLFKALSIEFRNRLVFGEVRKSDSTSSEVISSLNVSTFPTILVLSKESKGEAVKYEGAAKYAEIYAFLKKYAAPEPETKKKVEKEKKVKSKSKSTKTSSATSAKVEKTQEPFDPTIEELTCDDCLEKKCLGKEGVCVITFLTKEDDFEESIAAFEENMKLLQIMKKKYHAKNTKINFVWVNAIRNGKQLIRDLGVSDMFPSVVAIDKKKSQYSVLRMAFEADSLSTFLDVFLNGRSRSSFTKTLSLNKKPKESAKEENDEL